MSPSSPRYPSPASGDDAVPGGRHRRPESLADVTPPRRDAGTPSVRPHRHEPGGFAADRLVVSRQTHSHPAGERSRTAQARRGRHTAVRRRAATRPPVMGSHRAPGTLPIESWLLLGRKRQQILMASLVAVALALVAIPPARQGGLDAVNAATAGALGGRAGGKQAQRVPTVPSRRPAAAAGQDGTPSASRSAGSSAAPPPEAPVVRPSNHGPAQSLRITGTAAVALTFDDGPDPVETPKILALLEQYHVKATFCLVGQNVQKNPEIVRQIVAAGHTLCNHTWNHNLTIGLDEPDQIEADLARTTTAIQAAAPGAEVPFFRAPGGNFTDRLVSVASAAGMTSLYWAVDPRDWQHPAGENDAAHVDRVIAEIRKSVRPGSIVLSHDYHQPDTITAYAKLLPWLTEHFTVAIPERSVPAPATTPPSSGSTPAEPTPHAPSPTPTTSPGATSADNANSTG